MERRMVAAALVGASVLLCACAKDRDPCASVSPVAPSGCVTINVTASTPLLKVKQSFGFAANAVHRGDGSVVAVSQWSSDNTPVATVDAASGMVVGVANGTVNVIAEHDGVRQPAPLLRVVPDYQGRWAGDYAVTACRESGEFGGFCQDFPVGSVLSIGLQLTQPAATADGALILGELPFTVSGAIDSSGGLSLGDATITEEGVTLRLTGTALSLTPGGDLQGAFRTVWTASGHTGDAAFDARLRTVSRVSTTVGPSSARRGVARSWRDLVRAVVLR
jgi:hypothetical protein